jgi:hypothetical protein
MNLPELFDYKYYSNYYPDLKEAFGDNEELLKEHYLKYGYYENRKYFDIPDDFDWKKYILANPLFFPNMEDKTKKNAITHFFKNEYNPDKSYDDYKLIKNIDLDYKPIIILYYAFLNNDKNWKDMITQQIYDIMRTKIYEVLYKFHVVLLGKKNDIDELKNYLIQNYKNVELEFTEVYENKYEFPAIQKIKELAIENPDKLFIYSHSKGMVNHNPSSERTMIEKILTRKTVLDWETTLFIFETYPEIKKAGLSPAEGGWVWFNFWWARGSYITECKSLEKKEYYEESERFECEGWLGDGSKTWKDIYSLTRKLIHIPSDPLDELWLCGL